MIIPNPSDRAGYYNAAHSKYPGLTESNGIVAGCWMIGACYTNPSRMPDGTPFYGGYPKGYLERVHSMFPEARSFLHVFSGGLTLEMATQAMSRINFDDPPPTMIDIELVDLGGEGRHPTTKCSVEMMPIEWKERFDLVLADPPYSKDDAESCYGVKMYNNRRVMRELHRVTKPGGNMVWLDQKWPMHTKKQWKTWGTVSLVRSTQHRMRLITFFERQS